MTRAMKIARGAVLIAAAVWAPAISAAQTGRPAGDDAAVLLGEIETGRRGDPAQNIYVGWAARDPSLEPGVALVRERRPEGAERHGSLLVLTRLSDGLTVSARIAPGAPPQDVDLAVSAAAHRAFGAAPGERFLVLAAPAAEPAAAEEDGETEDADGDRGEADAAR